MSVVSEIIGSQKGIVTLRNDQFPSVLDAAKLMVQHRVGSVIIIDIDGKPVGMLTERDILKKVTSLSKTPKEIAVQDIMSFPVITIKAYDSIETAASIMSENKIKRLVVLEQDGSIAGILSITDIARNLTKILTTDYDRYGYLRPILDT